VVLVAADSAVVGSVVAAAALAAAVDRLAVGARRAVGSDATHA
jgi:hypothetical protein